MTASKSLIVGLFYRQRSNIRFQLNHGKLSVLVHPHTGEGNSHKDHTQHAIWIGKPVPLIEEMLQMIDRGNL